MENGIPKVSGEVNLGDGEIVDAHIITGHSEFHTFDMGTAYTIDYDKIDSLEKMKMVLSKIIPKVILYESRMTENDKLLIDMGLFVKEIK